MEIAIISYVNPINHPGYWPGMERLTEGIIKGFIENNCQVTLICSGLKNKFFYDPNFKIKIQTLKCIKFGLFALNIIDFTFKVRKIDLSKFNFIQIIGCSIDLRFIKKKYRNKIFSYYAHIDHIQSFRDYFYLPMVNNIQFNIFTHSKGVLLGIPPKSNEEQEFISFTKSKIKHTLNVREGVEKDNFPYFERKELDLNNLRLLYTGPLTPRKGVDVLIYGMTLIIKDYPDSVLTIVGSGYLEFKLKKLVRSLDLEKNVKFLGYISEKSLKKEFINNDIFVFASRKEGYPLAPLEAMSTGLPVIGSSLDPLKEIVSDTGYIFELDDFNDFYNKFSQMIKTDTRKLGKKASNRVETEFAWNNIITNYINFYNRSLVW